MTIHAFREVQTLLPEMTKIASEISEGFPVNNRANSLMSFLKAEYMLKVAGEKVPYDDLVSVQKAVGLFKIAEEAKALSDRMLSRTPSAQMTKQAATGQGGLDWAQSLVEHQRHGFTDLEKVAEASERLVDAHGDAVTSPVVRLYGGAEVFVKSAALAALEGRHRRFPEVGFDKIASALASRDDLSAEDIRRTCRGVIGLDRQCGLASEGWDFYADSFITKKAFVSALTVKVAGKEVPVESILRLPVGQILGEDVAKEMGSDPETVKAVIEALPRDQQQLLATRV